MPDTLTPEEIKREPLLLAEMQVLLAQLRTHLSLLRTGLTMFVSSMTAVFLLMTNITLLPSFLQNFEMETICILAVCSVFGLYLFIKSEWKLRAINKLIKKSESENKRIDELMV